VLSDRNNLCRRRIRYATKCWSARPMGGGASGSPCRRPMIRKYDPSFDLAVGNPLKKKSEQRRRLQFLLNQGSQRALPERAGSWIS